MSCRNVHGHWYRTIRTEMGARPCGFRWLSTITAWIHRNSNIRLFSARRFAPSVESELDLCVLTELRAASPCFRPGRGSPPATGTQGKTRSFAFTVGPPPSSRQCSSESNHRTIHEVLAEFVWSGLVHRCVVADHVLADPNNLHHETDLLCRSGHIDSEDDFVSGRGITRGRHAQDLDLGSDSGRRAATGIDRGDLFLHEIVKDLLQANRGLR